MRLRVDLDRRDKKYHYGQTAKMSISVTNDGEETAIVHKVEARILTEKWQNVSQGSMRVDPGKSKHLGDASFVVGLWSAGRGALFEGRALYTAQEKPPHWSTEQETIDRGSIDVEAAPPNGRKVFVSHSNMDKDLVAKIAEALRLFGFAPYVAEDHTKPGKNLWGKITKNMSDSHAALVILTESALESNGVWEEIGRAQMMRHLRPKGTDFEIIPVVAGGVDAGMLSGSLAGCECAILDTERPGGGMDDIMDAVCKSLGMAGVW